MSAGHQSIFDYRQVRRAFDGAADGYDQHAVLQREVAQRLLGRLEWLKVSPGRILDLGAGTGESLPKLMKHFPGASTLAMDLSMNMLANARQRRLWLRRPAVVCADARSVPLVDSSIDMVYSNLLLQWCDPLETVLAEVVRILRADGVFLFSTFGPDTLKELRQCWSAVDDAAHVHPFADMHDIGDALVKAGFQEPVMDREEIVMTYPSIDSVLADVRHIGAGNALTRRPRGLTGKHRYREFVAAYEALRSNGTLPATYELVYGTAWSGRTHRQGMARIDIDSIGRPGGGIRS